jgi:hypothetical protein
LLAAAPFADALLATVLPALDLRRAALAERALARVDAALLAVAERERAIGLLPRLALVELLRERGVESAMVSPPGIG